jgi:hypothetical protein
MFISKIDYLLAAGAGETSAGSFFTTNPFGKVLASVMGIAGIVLLLVGIVRAIGKIAGGKVGEAVKTVLITGIFAVFLIQPALVGTLVDSLSNGVKTVMSGFQEATK